MRLVYRVRIGPRTLGGDHPRSATAYAPIIVGTSRDDGSPQRETLRGFDESREQPSLSLENCKFAAEPDVASGGRPGYFRTFLPLGEERQHELV
jgi:hypothetical protein